MNWFQQHLNWTAAFGILIGFLVSSFGGLDSLDSVPYGLGSLLFDIFSNNRFDGRQLIFIFFGVALSLFVLTWILIEKGRSPWWLLVAFAPLGWLGFLCLGNKKYALIANAKTRVYHNPNCKIIQKINPEYILRFFSQTEAEEDGYIPCKNCKPNLQKLRFEHNKPPSKDLAILRQVFYWAGIIIIALLVFAANRYPVPVVGYEETTGGQFERERDVLLPVRDYSQVPLWVRIGAENHSLVFLVGVALCIVAIVDMQRNIIHNNGAR